MSTSPGDIRIRVKCRYLREQSRPEEKKFVFSYTITIANLGRSAAQLMSRRWLITDANGRTQKVAGAGVVGETPVIEPGTDYTYSSGAIIETKSGTMSGAYQMRAADGAEFEVPIPEFVLLPPDMLH